MAAKQGRETTIKREAAGWILAAGYQVSQRTVYNHMTAGKLRPGRGGVWREAAVLEYAANTWPRKETGQTRAEEKQASAAGARTEADAELKRLQARRLR